MGDTPGDRASEGDIIAFDAYDDGHGRTAVDEPVQGKVMIATESILRVRGIGAVDVERSDVIEVVESAE